ncbi:MAG: energy-coupling factor ABC transporter ATP-binding protein, partial [Brevibacterium sp.]|nr:energy-coupling factor ABC transporter ATP-binding protein [Brevibacterium sp.]
DGDQYGIWDTRPRDRHRTTSAATDVPACPKPASLTVRGLTIARSGASVLNDADLDVASGELVTIMGSNGAGKSTLLRSLAGLLRTRDRPSGTVTVDDQGTAVHIGDAPAHERAQHFGWVGQDPGSQLSAATVREELMHAAPLPPHRRRDREVIRARRQEAVTSALAAAELTEVSETHPYDLSIDGRKDLVMASALIMDPRILLLDEPTLGRDRKAIGRLNMIMAEFIRRGGSVLATTHDRRWAAEVSDRILRLGEGELREDPGRSEIV